MYIQDSPQNKYHVEVYGHPSKVGFKDVALTWHGRDFDPEHLIQLYKKAGAKYFMSMGVHHDNFDLWNSAHQPRWNAVATGPKKRCRRPLGRRCPQERPEDSPSASISPTATTGSP